MVCDVHLGYVLTAAYLHNFNIFFFYIGHPVALHKLPLLTFINTTGYIDIPVYYIGYMFQSITWQSSGP
jgi:hypothetical protein